MGLMLDMSVGKVLLPFISHREWHYPFRNQVSGLGIEQFKANVIFPTPVVFLIALLLATMVD